MEMASFKVKQSALEMGSQELRQYRNTLRTVRASVEESARVMSRMHTNVMICASLSKIVSKTGQYVNNAGNMALVLEEIAELYGNTDRTLTDSIKGQADVLGNSSKGTDSGDGIEKGIMERFWGWICGLFGWGDDSDGTYEIDSVVFDDTGEYGGNQGSPMVVPRGSSEEEAIYDVVRRHFPDMSDEEIRDYLTKLNTEGCSYAATINTILAAYEGREEVFEKIFGFPMYKNGDLNYDELLVDFYCETDNHNKNIWGEDYVNLFEDISSVEGEGVNEKQQIYRAGLYLINKGVDVEISAPRITVDNFKEYAENGYVVLDYFNGPLLREDGSVAQNLTGHAMTITGVTEDGKYIVSSWGGKYYIDPSQGGCTFIYYEYH